MVPEIALPTRKTPTEPIAIPSAGEVLPDGRVIELVRDPANPNRLRLLSWRNDSYSVEDHVECGGARYIPIDFGSFIPVEVRLPTHVAGKESPRNLFAAIQSLCADYLRQSEVFSILLTFFVFVSWTADVLPSCPILWVNTSPTSPKCATLQLLSALCRHPIVLVGVRRTDFQRLPWLLKPSLILDEPDLHAALQRVLLGSTRRSACVAAGTRLLNFYGCKLVFSAKFPIDALRRAETIKLSLIPPRSRAVVLDEVAEQKIAKEFQARLLGFRLRYLRDVRAPKLDLRDFNSPRQDLARALCAAIACDTELVDMLLPVLRRQDDEFRVDLSASLDSVLSEALLAFDHEPLKRDIRAIDLAERVNAIYSGRGLTFRVSAEKVGWRLRDLGIPTGRIGSIGHGVKVSFATSRLIHELAVAHEVPTLRVGGSRGCRFCKELEGEISKLR